MAHQMISELSRRLVFSAAHRLHSPQLSDAENKKIFGKCNHPHGHGHNYVLDVTLRGPINLQTGMVFNLSELKEILIHEVESRLDHKNLNLDVAEFKTLNPTAENIALQVWKWLEPRLKDLLFEVKLQETENNTATIRRP